MSNLDKFYVGDTPLILVDCVKDISGFSLVEILAIKPSGATETFDVTVLNDENSGLPRFLEYQTLAGDLDEVGEWKFHSHVVISGMDLHGEVATQEIFALGT